MTFIIIKVQDLNTIIYRVSSNILKPNLNLVRYNKYSLSPNYMIVAKIGIANALEQNSTIADTEINY